MGVIGVPAYSIPGVPISDASTITWSLDRIRAEFRNLTGEHLTDTLVDSVVEDNINDYYQNYFPEEAGLGELRVDFSQITAASDGGEYAISNDVIAVESPVWIDGEEIPLHTDRAEFFRKYPESTDAGKPEAAFVDGPKLILRPSPDAAYTFKSRLSLQRPAALANDGDVPLDPKWGRCIAVGAALLYITNNSGDAERITELALLKRSLLSSIKAKRIIQWVRGGRVVSPGF